MRRISEGPGRTLYLHARRAQKWTASAAALLCGAVCLILSLRGIAGAAQGRPAFLLLCLFGVVGCALVLKSWSDVMSGSGRIVIDPASRSVRFAGLPKATRAALGIRNSGVAEIGFDQVGSVEILDDDSHFGKRSRVVLKLRDLRHTVVLLDDDLDGGRAEALRRKVEYALGSRSGTAADTTTTQLGEASASTHAHPALALLQYGFQALAAIGAVAFLSGFFVSVVPVTALDRVELPLGAPQGLLEDRHGRILIGSKSYLRLQRYHPDGRFDRAWRAPAVKGDWRLAQEDKDTVVLQSLPSGCWTIDERRVSGPMPCPADLVFMEPAAARSAAGDRLELRAWPLQVIRTSRAGLQEVVVSQGWLRNALRSPLPAFVLLVAGVAGSLIVRTRR